MILLYFAVPIFLQPQAVFVWNLLIQNVIVSVYLLCVDDLSLIITYQEDESIWKILEIEN